MTFIDKLTRTPSIDHRSGSAPLPFEWIVPLAVLTDFVLVAASAVAADFIYAHLFLGLETSPETALAMASAAFSYFALITGCRGGYRISHLLTPSGQNRHMTVSWIFAFLAMVVAAFVLKLAPLLSRGCVLLFFLLGWAALTAWRSSVTTTKMQARLATFFAPRSVILIGSGARQTPWRSRLARYGYRIAAEYQLGDFTHARDLVDHLHAEAIKHARIDSVVLALDWRERAAITALVTECAVLPLPVRLLPDDALASYGNLPNVTVGSFRLAELQRAPLSRVEQIVKRSLDLTLASLLLVVLSPVMAAAAILVKVDSPGPVIFRQTRKGFNGRAFRIFKLRTMRTMEDGPVIRQAVRDDVRLTRIGRWLRRASIDELPQLLNVLRGEMSLVGPRPHAIAHDEQYAQFIENYAFRHHVKPGLTGWAQIRGSRGPTLTIEAMRRRIELDVWYVNNWSFWLDIRILARTAGCVLADPNAF